MLLWVNTVEPRCVQTENLALGFHCQVYAILRLEVLRHLKGHEFLYEPLRFPEGVVTAEEELVRANPEKQVRHNLGKVAWAGLDERQSDGQPTIDVGLLGGYPAEVLQAWQPHMLNNEGQLGELGGGIVDVGDVKGIAVEWEDGGTLVDMDVGDTELGTLLQIAIGFWIGELIALG